MKKWHIELKFCKLKFHGTRVWQAQIPNTFFPDNQQININIKISNFFHLNAQTYVFIYLNRSIVKYRNFNFKILIFRPLTPLVHSFLTHSSISNFSEVLWSNWSKYWGLQWEIRTCKRKTDSTLARVPCGICSIKKSTSEQVFLWNLSV